MAKHIGTFIVVLVLAAAAAGVAWTVYQRSLEEAGESGREGGALPVAVEVAPVESGSMRDARTLSGTLQASSRFVVSSKVGGRIREMLVDLGDPVGRDEVIAKVDDAEFVQAVAQADAELKVREATRDQAASALDLAKREHERVLQLREKGIAPESRVDETAAALASAQAALAVAESQVAQANATLELAKIRMGYATVRANWSGSAASGLVSERHQNAGNTIQAGDPIVNVVVLDPLTVVVSVTERDYPQLSVGQAATLRTDALPGETFEATVVRIAPVFRESSRQARVELRVENEDQRLKPGMFVRATIVLRELEAEAIVPVAALARRQGDSVIYLVNEPEATTVREVRIRPGVVEAGRMQVAPLDEGVSITGRVVVLGQHLLEDGATINIVEAGISEIEELSAEDQQANATGPGP